MTTKITPSKCFMYLLNPGGEFLSAKNRQKWPKIDKNDPEI